MKLLRSLSVFALSTILFACGGGDKSSEKGIDLKVQLDSASNATFYIEKLTHNDRFPVDTIELNEDGMGSSSSFGEESYAIYSLYSPDYDGEVRFVGKSGDAINVLGNAKNLLFSSSLSGNESLERMNEFTTLSLNHKKLNDSLNNVYLKLKKRNEHYAVEGKLQKIYREKFIAFENDLKKMIDAAPDEFSNLIMVRSLNPKRDIQYYQKVDSAMMAKYPDNSYAQAFNREVKSLAALSVGGTAPEFVLPSYEGPDKKLSDYRGKYVLLDFWATWCKPCIAEIPYLAKAKEQFGNQNFEIISVCIDRPEFKTQWNKIIEDHGHHWVQLFDASGETSKSYNIKAFPTIVLLDPEGKVMVSSADQATAGFRRDAILNKLAEIFPNQ